MGWPKTSGTSGAASAVSDSPRHSRRTSSDRIGGLRTSLTALALMLAAPAGAFAADMPDLAARLLHADLHPLGGILFWRTDPERPWGSGDLGNADNSLVSYMLANTELQSNVTNFTTLPKSVTGGASYGGFIGYNWQWDDVVLGAELNYNHMSLGMTARTIRPITY